MASDAAQELQGGDRPAPTGSDAGSAYVSRFLTQAQRDVNARVKREQGSSIRNMLLRSEPLTPKMFKTDLSNPLVQCEAKLGFRIMLEGSDGRSWLYPESQCGDPVTDKETAYEQTRAALEYWGYQVRMNNHMKRALLRTWLTKRLAREQDILNIDALRRQAASEAAEEVARLLDTDVDSLEPSARDPVSGAAIFPPAIGSALRRVAMEKLAKLSAEAFGAYMAELWKEVPEDFHERIAEVVLVSQRVMSRYILDKAGKLKAKQQPRHLLDNLVTALRVSDDASLGVTAATEPDAAKRAAKVILEQALTVARVNLKYPGVAGYDKRVGAACTTAGGRVLQEDSTADAECVPDWVASQQERLERGEAVAMVDFWREVNAYMKAQDSAAKNKLKAALSPGHKPTVASKMIAEAAGSPARARSSSPHGASPARGGITTRSGRHVTAK